SGHTPAFPERLRELGASLLISTYQTGKLVCAREREGTLNTHFRDFDKPMGIAVAPGRFALGTRSEVWDLRDVPAAAPKLEPAGVHDACYLPRNRHVTGDVAVHEMGFAGGELWLVATAFSCLATLDAHHSFVPRWKPPFVSALAPEDRCHLNGMAIVDDRVRYVTALGQTDERGGWRERKADGGVLLEVPSGEVVAAGLSMPHSPRWHGGRLWVLESGRGTLAVVDRATGRAEAVAELPGFTRGLAFAGTTAFVGLSQIRESSTFGDLPLTNRLRERLCGVWMVDVTRGTVEGFLRFDDLVQEVFDVALLPGARHPEIAEPHGAPVATSYVLP
ncbi:MAG: TIGR03032 family protein, partial [Actinomycetota bacterium]|nr:TIGR03032 family protein [Actinomycetota bacterium]